MGVSIVSSIHSIASFTQQVLALLEVREKANMEMLPEKETLESFAGTIAAPDSMGPPFVGLHGRIAGVHGNRIYVDFKVEAGNARRLTVRRLLPASMLLDVDR